MTDYDRERDRLWEAIDDAICRVYDLAQDGDDVGIYEAAKECRLVILAELDRLTAENAALREVVEAAKRWSAYRTGPLSPSEKRLFLALDRLEER